VEPTFADHFSAVAKEYALFRPRYPEALFDYLATLVPADAWVWDCAAGSGQATEGLARRFARVVATDASAEQLAHAPRLPNVEYRAALAEDSGLPSAAFSLVTVAQALHWFDLPRFYAEARRVSRPGGVLAVWCYATCELEGSVANALLARYYSETLGPYWPPERRHVEAGYRTLPFPFEEFPAPAFHMEAEWTLPQLLGYLATWSARRRFLAETGLDPLVPFAQELARHWGDPERPRRVRWPVLLRVGRVSADRG
jgi:SAM-dependent methyltransferase